MPVEITALMVLMWLQTALGVVMTFIAFAFLVMMGLPSLDVLPWYIYLFLVPLLVPGPLSVLIAMRRRGAWVAAVVIEGLAALEYGGTAFTLFGVFNIVVVGVALALAILFILFRINRTGWFER
ncbi:hypothetical protein [Streptosporangium pseudovulgare]|uniref:ABC transporter permease n=1 Tax=Streptosporangium pseudovulgare TaxID=35765 RepID=A0ABQ2R0K6_9ACTN|nr:hypothetical protein [Streptosporangium pseudovulgare]GGQ07443.1 hypothetical protein GCM10010140_42090 [Streptosporangium pseudovulgare]